jgi:hypothetical protein
MSYVHVRCRDIVDGDGRPLLLRGVGLGNWLLPEGYMWGFGDGLASPRQIEARIERLIGAAAAADFWKRFRDVFVTEQDIARIAELGFDHVRLPINSRVLLTDDGALRADGFGLVDRVVQWCERHGLWVLLDLHGAPGGQTGTNIDDSPNGRPELFMDARYRRMTVALWREIARRYHDRTTVLGYDLLNEPLPNEWRHRYGRALIRLYEEITAAIRAVDPHHLVMYEGPHWAIDVSVFTRVLDPNSVVQFHRYWCAPERASIAAYLEARDRLGVPIYMGEGGENTPEWIYSATRRTSSTASAGTSGPGKSWTPAHHRCRRRPRTAGIGSPTSPTSPTRPPPKSCSTPCSTTSHSTAVSPVQTWSTHSSAAHRCPCRPGATSSRTRPRRVASPVTTRPNWRRSGTTRPANRPTSRWRSP